MHAKRKAVLASAIVTAALATGAAQAQQQTCFPSKFGPSDQVGNLNHVTPEKTLAAVKLVTKGKSYRLGIETNKDTPASTTSTTTATRAPSSRRRAA